MTLFSTPKSGAPTVPERCWRCRVRRGTSRLAFGGGRDAPLPAREQTAWLCDECRTDVQREADHN
jgi:hypothetical protein